MSSLGGSDIYTLLNLLIQRVPLHVLAKRLGHQNAMHTATIYAHIYDEQAEGAAVTFKILFMLRRRRA